MQNCMTETSQGVSGLLVFYPFLYPFSYPYHPPSYRPTLRSPFPFSRLRGALSSHTAQAIFQNPNSENVEDATFSQCTFIVERRSWLSRQLRELAINRDHANCVRRQVCTRSVISVKVNRDDDFRFPYITNVQCICFGVHNLLNTYLTCWFVLCQIF